MKRLSAFLGAAIERRRATIVVIALIISVVSALGVLRVDIVTSQDTLISRESDAFRDYERFSQSFGGDQILVLFSGDPDTILTPPTADSIAGLEDELAADSRIHLVVNPLTFLEGAALRAAAAGGGDPDALLRDPRFVHSVIFGDGDTPQPTFANLVPDNEHVLFVITLAGDLDFDEQRQVAGDVRSIVEGYSFADGSVLIAGTPMLIDGIIGSVLRSMAVTGLLTVVLMIVVLSLLFSARWRLVSLAVVLVGVLWTFGIVGFVSLPITLISMAGLPILIGLGVDYTIQFHNRYDEEIRRGDTPALAVIEAITHIGPAVGIAVFVTALGFLVLLFSPVPAIRDFGLMITLGVVVLYLLGFFLLSAILYWRDSRAGDGIVPEDSIPSESRIGAFLATMAAHAIARPFLIVAVALPLALVGFYLDEKLPVQTDVERLIPESIQELADLNEARAVVTTATEITVLVEAEDVTDPAVLEWIVSYENAQLANPDVLSASSVASLAVATNGDAVPDRDTVEALLQDLPAPVRGSLVAEDRRAAAIRFGVKLIPLDEMDRLVSEMDAAIDAPAGVNATPTGTVVLGARTVSSLTENRLLITLAALATVGLTLALIYRSLTRSLIVLLPIGLVIGWSSGFMYLVGIDLNPLTAVLGSLIVGIGTDFTVLLTERYYEEKGNGTSPREAMLTAISQIGRAITASGLTVVAGFGALIASDFPVLQDFGRVVVIDMLLALLTAVIVVPAILVWWDGRPSGRSSRRPIERTAV